MSITSTLISNLKTTSFNNLTDAIQMGGVTILSENTTRVLSFGSTLNTNKYFDRIDFFVRNAATTNVVSRMRIVDGANGNVTIGSNADPNSTLQVVGSQSGSIFSISANVTLDVTHNTVIIPTGSSFTVTLPSASGITGRQYRIVNKVSGSITIGNYVNLLGATVSTIASGTSILVQSDGTSWQQIQ
jgi:hypothetical protein